MRESGQSLSERRRSAREVRSREYAVGDAPRSGLRQAPALGQEVAPARRAAPVNLSGPGLRRFLNFGPSTLHLSLANSSPVSVIG